MTRTIVVEVDQSAEGLRVLDYAAAEAMRTDAELLMVAPFHASASYSPMTPFHAPQPPQELADASLRDAAARVRRQFGADAPPVRTLRQEGSRLRVLVKASRSASLLIVCRRLARGPHRLMAARHDLALAARSACPVLVVPGRWRPSAADRTVYVGLGGPSVALEFAFRTAAGRGGTVVAVSTAIAAGADELARVADRFPGVQVRMMESSGSLADVLARCSLEAGMVVVGTAEDSRTALADPLPRHTLAASTCPVAVVRGRVPAVRPRRSHAGEFVIPTY